MASQKNPHSLLSIKLPTNIRITITIALLALVVVLTALHFYLPAHRVTIEFFALSLTAASAIGSLFYLARTLQGHLEQRPKDRAWKLVDRWNSPNFFYCRKSLHEVLEIYRLNGNSQAKATEFLDHATHQENATNTRNVLNVFEEMAVAVNMGEADEQLLLDTFKSPIIQTFVALEHWITLHRERAGRDTLWEHGQGLYKRWKI